MFAKEILYANIVKTNAVRSRLVDSFGSGCTGNKFHIRLIPLGFNNFSKSKDIA